jgi:hypothetical protein
MTGLLFPSNVLGRFRGRKFHAHVKPSEERSRKCALCEGPVHRSWRTGVLHSKCYACRYLVMIYGPSIEVERVVERSEA